MKNKQRFVERIAEMELKTHRKEANEKAAELKRISERSEELNRIFRQLYEDKVLGRIDAVQYQFLSDGYTKELNEIKSRIPLLKNELRQFQQTSSNINKFVELANKYVHITKLTPEVIRTFISKIVIHQTPEGSAAKYRIEIFFTHLGSLQEERANEQAA